MTQFNLEEWLQDKSRKVVTRDGRQVRIVWWELKCNTPIIAAIQWNQEREDAYCYDTAGRCANNVGELDLFFADENGLNEFENKLADFLIYSHPMDTKSTKSMVKRISKQLLDLARKELQITDYLNGYAQGKQDTLKTTLESLPKWKKANVFVSNEFGLATRDDDLIITCNGYQIKLSDLKALPKEE